MLELAVKALIAYLLGSLMGALLLGAARGVDIRSLGSGNAGGTNALRTQGTWFALGVVVIDVSKGWAAAALLPHWQMPFGFSVPTLSRDELTVACAIAVVGVVAIAVTIALPPVLAVWLVTVVLTGYVGLSTMLAMLALPVVFELRGDTSAAMLNFAVLMSIFVIYTHRANIQRMRMGHENRARRIWVGTYLRRHSS